MDTIDREIKCIVNDESSHTILGCSSGINRDALTSVKALGGEPGPGINVDDKCHNNEIKLQISTPGGTNNIMQENKISEVSGNSTITIGECHEEHVANEKITSNQKSASNEDMLEDQHHNNEIKLQINSFNGTNNNMQENNKSEVSGNSTITIEDGDMGSGANEENTSNEKSVANEENVEEQYHSNEIKPQISTCDGNNKNMQENENFVVFGNSGITIERGNDKYDINEKIISNAKIVSNKKRVSNEDNVMNEDYMTNNSHLANEDDVNNGPYEQSNANKHLASCPTHPIHVLSVIQEDIRDLEISNCTDKDHQMLANGKAIETISLLDESSDSSKDTSSSSSESSSMSSWEDSSDSDSVNDGTTEQNTSGKNGLHANRRLPKTKDELTFADLPQVFPLDPCIDESVKLVPLGEIDQIVFDDAVVIIKSYENTPAIDADSVLFLENRTAFGKVFDTFGQVVRPHYCVRFNSKEEIKSRKVDTGDTLYFAPDSKDLTTFVFISQLKNIKGSDASWEHDQEPPPEFEDYSDDETEKKVKAKRRRAFQLNKRHEEHKQKEETEEHHKGIKKQRYSQPHAKTVPTKVINQPQFTQRGGYLTPLLPIPPTLQTFGSNPRASLTNMDVQHQLFPQPHNRPQVHQHNSHRPSQWVNPQQPFSTPVIRPALHQPNTPISQQSMIPGNPSNKLSSRNFMMPQGPSLHPQPLIREEHQMTTYPPRLHPQNNNICRPFHNSTLQHQEPRWNVSPQNAQTGCQTWTVRSNKSPCTNRWHIAQQKTKMEASFPSILEPNNQASTGNGPPQNVGMGLQSSTPGNHAAQPTTCWPVGHPDQLSPPYIKEELARTEPPYPIGHRLFPLPNRPPLMNQHPPSLPLPNRPLIQNPRPGVNLQLRPPQIKQEPPPDVKKYLDM